jgi:hypothetical protein
MKKDMVDEEYVEWMDVYAWRLYPTFIYFSVLKYYSKRIDVCDKSLGRQKHTRA